MTAIIEPKQLIHFYSAELLAGGVLSGKQKFHVSQIPVLDENERFLVIQDWTFTTILKKAEKNSIYPGLNCPSIAVHVADRVWGSGVQYRLYSTHVKRASTIQSEIEAAVFNKVGHFMQGIDLRLIKDNLSKAVSDA